MAAPTAIELKKLQQGFPQKALVCAAVIAAIHVLPKSADDKTTRLIFTVFYFAAAIALLWLMDRPRSAYLKQRFQLQYAEGGPALEQIWRMYLLALDRFCHIVCLLMLAFVGANAIRILAQWAPAFSALTPIADLVWWGSLAGLVLFPKWGRGYASDVLQKRRILMESVATADFQPRSIAAMQAAAEDPNEPAVKATGDHKFKAGNFEWNWKDFYKSGIIFGMTGSGKTVCLLNALLEGLFVSTREPAERCAGLLLDPKGDFNAKIRNLCRKYDRESDLVIIDPYNTAQSIHWNPLDSEDDELEIAARFAAALEALGMKAGGGDSFWIDNAKKFIRHSIRLLRAANPEGQPPTLAQIGELASSLKKVSEAADRVPEDNPDGDQCLAFFADEWAGLADQTRSSIQSYISNMIDPFLLEPYATLFSGRSSMRIADMIDKGKILYVYMPVADKENMSKVVCTFVKMEYYREVLKRAEKARSSFFFCDEFQSYFTPMPGKGDADFFERSRQSNHANLIATQNYPALMKVAGNQDSVVNNLLGNCGVKIFLRNTDEKTNEYASKLFGERLVAMASSSLNQGMGRSMGSAGSSANRQYDRNVRPEEFTGLAIPAGDTKHADTIIHLASREKVTKETLRWRMHFLKSDK